MYRISKFDSISEQAISNEISNIKILEKITRQIRNERRVIESKL